MTKTFTAPILVVIGAVLITIDTITDNFPLFVIGAIVGYIGILIYCTKDK